jgi:receptor protein-tyrosine kinase
MGRVDEAMRRARGEVSTPVPSVVTELEESAEQVRLNVSEALPAGEPEADPEDEPQMSDPVSAAATVEQRSAMFRGLDTELEGKVVIDREIVAASREQYRRLAATLLHGQSNNGLKVIMVTSAAVAEGKTLTAVNLALTFSESYRRRVLLIDGDLRRPSLQRIFKFDVPLGLSESLMLPADQPLSLHRASSRLWIVPAGAPSSDPMAGLSSTRMHRIIEEARDAFDWVIIDTPPIGLLSDASLISVKVDGVVIVVKAGATPYTQVERAVAAVGRERVVGVVLNRVSADQGLGYYSYSHYYGAQRSET